MLRSDAQGHKLHNVSSNINSINIDVISHIERELDPYDLVSIVFLLYDIPDTALQRLIVFQRVSKDIGENNLNLLYNWAQHAQSRPSWRYEFLEALAICQLNNVIRKLGFEVASVKKHYMPNNMHACHHINPMKKALYKLCENITSSNLEKLKNTLKTYDIDTMEHNSCELVLLELMCKKFIIVDNPSERKAPNGVYQIGKLAKIIQNFSGLQRFASDLKDIESRYNGELKVGNPGSSTSSSTVEKKAIDSVQDDHKEHNDDDKFTASAFEDLYKFINDLKLEESTVKNLKSDTKKLNEEAYAIKNATRVGVCYIINQEDFYPSKDSIEGLGSSTSDLDKRLGSNMDRKVLEITMTALKFEVIIHRNLDHKKMVECIKEIIKYRVHHDDSMFMLCILSHGVRGHVYASDSVKVKIEYIQHLLDESLRQRELYDIPKIMILQACQVNNTEEPRINLVADSPNYHLRKSNFLVYWATAPELEAYRDEKKGSIFIQILCYIIQKHARHEHLYDIFTKVTDGVARICTKLQKDQVPIFESTLRKKLFLQIPE